MKSWSSIRWWRLAAPPMAAAWLGACGVPSNANLENGQSTSPAVATTSAEAAGRESAMQALSELAADGGGSRSAIGAGPAAGGGGTAGSVAADGGSQDAGSAAPSGGTGGANAPVTPAAGAGAGGGGSSGAVAGGGASGSAGEPAAMGGTGGGTAAPGASFSGVYAVLTAGCSCHLAGAGGLDLSTRAIARASLVGVASRACTGELRVAAGDPERSVLVHTLEHSDLGNCSVPQMPAGADKLDASALATVRAWIAAGAQDD